MKRVNCKICGAEFEITTNAHNTKTCEKHRALRKKLYMRKYMADRYRSDPDFRKRMIEANERYRKENREKYNEHHRNYYQRRKEENEND